VQRVNVQAMRTVFHQHGLTTPPLNWQLQGWANVCHDGAFNSTHCHPGSTRSAVNCLYAGGPVSLSHAGSSEI